MNGMNFFDDEQKSNLVHYEGELGVFDYDPREFEIAFFCGEEYLHYCGNGKSVNLPDGCINTRNMFRECHLPVGFSLGISLILVELQVWRLCLVSVLYQKVFLLEIVLTLQML